jgi:hypothetical protein
MVLVVCSTNEKKVCVTSYRYSHDIRLFDTFAMFQLILSYSVDDVIFLEQQKPVGCVRRTVDKKQHNLWIPENPSCIPVYLRSLFHLNHYLFIIHHDSDTPSYGCCCCWWWWYQGDSKLSPSLVVTTTIIIIVHTISDDLSKFP